MANLCTLPPELHAHIAYLSCLGDTGNTISSLSRVSKYFNAAIRPYLFHTVSVTGINKIALLDAALQKLAAPSLSSVGPGMENLYMGVTQLPSPSERETLISTIHRILTLSSKSLRTLTLDLSGALQDSSILLARVFRMPFPLLEDMTLVGFYPNPTIPSRPPSPRSSLPPSPTSSQPPSPSATRPAARLIPLDEVQPVERESNFPSVRRLHLSGNRNPSGLLGVGNLAQVFPRLEELKVSGLSMAVGFAAEVFGALQRSSPEFTSLRRISESSFFAPTETYLQDFTPQLPPRLRLLRVQPAPAIELSTGVVVSTSAVWKDRDMFGQFLQADMDYGALAERAGLYRGGSGEGRVRFELLDRAFVGQVEVWEEWRSRLLR